MFRPEVVMLEQAQRSWVARAWTFPRKILALTVAQVKKRYNQLKDRYGPNYTRAMVAVVFISLFSPMPASTLVGIALIVVIAEAHRAISRSGPERKTIAKERVAVFVNCDVIVRSSATSGQLGALGAALWRWCRSGEGTAGIYQYVDNQALADVIAGKLPAPSRSGRPSVYFMAFGELAFDRRTAIDSLRRQIPTEAIEEVLVDGKNWELAD